MHVFCHRPYKATESSALCAPVHGGTNMHDFCGLPVLCLVWLVSDVINDQKARDKQMFPRPVIRSFAI